MIRRPPRSTQSRSSAASDVYKRQPISLMKAYFSIVDNIPDWNIVLPPLKKIENPTNQKLVLILKELVKKIDPLIANT